MVTERSGVGCSRISIASAGATDGGPKGHSTHWSNLTNAVGLPGTIFRGSSPMKQMLSELAHDKEFPLLIASMPANAQQHRIAFGVVIFFTASFATVMPFATIQLARIDAFILTTQSIVLFADLITAVFLFAQ